MMFPRTLQSVPPDVLKGWSGALSQLGFPAAADRLICWAPKDLARRLQWSFPQGGYEVNHKQGGSDHRPVRLEVQLTLQPSREEPVKGEELELPPDLLQAVAEDEEGDGGESPGLLNSLASAVVCPKPTSSNPDAPVFPDYNLGINYSSELQVDAPHIVGFIRASGQAMSITFKVEDFYGEQVVPETTVQLQELSDAVPSSCTCTNPTIPVQVSSTYGSST
eukprot:g8653.t1